MMAAFPFTDIDWNHEETNVGQRFVALMGLVAAVTTFVAVALILTAGIGMGSRTVLIVKVLVPGTIGAELYARAHNRYSPWASGGRDGDH